MIWTDIADILVGSLGTIVACLSIYIKYLNSKQKEAKEEAERIAKEAEEKALKEAERDNSRDKALINMAGIMLIDKMEFYIRQGWASTHKKQQITDLFEGYKELGGNGAVESAIENFNKIPQIPESKKQ